MIAQARKSGLYKMLVKVPGTVSKMLVKACKDSGMSAAQQLIFYDIAYGLDYTTHLLAAASDGHAELVQELLAAGADGAKALRDAVHSDDAKTVQQLVNAGVDVSVADQDGSTHCMQLPVVTCAQQ